MKSSQFHYHAPESLSDVLDLLGEHGDEAKPLAGGQSLVPLMAMRLGRFEHLVDLNRVTGLGSIDEADGVVRIGAMTRQAEVAINPILATAIPLLAMATAYVGHPQIRNRGTVGGSVVHADPAAEYPAVAVVLDAELEIASNGGLRRVSATDFLEGAFTTSLADDELLVALHFQRWAGQTGYSFSEVARRHGDFALVGTAVAVQTDANSVIERAAIALFGVEDRPRRATDAEVALVGNSVDRINSGELGQLAVQDLDPVDDIHASAIYRQKVGAHIVGEAITSAAHRATGESEGSCA